MSDATELVADLRRPWRHGEHVDARGLVLEAPLILDGMEVRGFDLSGAVLKGGLRARGATFRGLAWLRGAEVRGVCDLSGATFRSDLRADRLSADSFILDHCVLQGVLSLAGSTLGALRLNQALVMANLTLQDAQIAGLVDLDGTEIMGGFWTAGARFGRVTDRGANISGRVRLAR
ncbi:MAG: hypothetical protein AB8B51_06880 [Sedimentitalea sp.]